MALPLKTYPLTSTLAGVLSDDYLYFEGAARPASFSLLCDKISSEVPEKATQREIMELESYFNDMYNLFLRKLTQFVAVSPSVSDTTEPALKLQALLQELIKVKDLIENAGQVDIMGR